MTMKLILAVAAVACTSGAPPARRAVAIEQFKFQPDVIQASVGDTIVWENRDIVQHTATATDKSWDSGEINAGKRAVTVVRKKGEQEFICALHPSMKGKLIVR
jgi:plastocyanin